MSKITKEDFIDNYKKYNGCQALLASHYSLSERSIRTYKAKFIEKVELVAKEALKQDYLVDKLAIAEIARKHKVSRDTIYRLIDKYSLSRESRYDIASIREAYSKKNYNLTDLAKLSGIANRASLISLLDTYNIKNQLKDDITELYKIGLSNAEIAKELALSEQDVSYNLMHHSIFREKKIVIDLDELENLRQHKTLEQLAELYKCSSRTISTYIKKLNVDRKTNKIQLDINKVTQLYVEQNLTMDEIADVFSCSRTTIQNFIRDNEIVSTNKETMYERLIREFLVNNGIAFEQNTRAIIKPKEIDFYLPEHKIGIELCGLYWHSTKINSDKLHIKKKHDLCKNMGIRLITIFEDELVGNFDIVINRLQQTLKLTKPLGYARNCSIKEITNKEGIDFLNKYHIQGSGKNYLYLGAFLGGQLVSVMSFSSRNPAKGQSKNMVELNRFVNPFSITGIASKLFKYYYKTYKPAEVISYSDNRWNTGDLYKLLGFSIIRVTEYNYWYVVRQTRKHRFAFTKQRLLALFPEESSNQTEQQIAEKHDLYRIYDCGSTVYKWLPPKETPFQ